MSKEHAYAYEAGYHDGATHYELDHCPSCKNTADLQDALAENARLRELMYERAHKHAIHHMTEDELRITAANVMTENAKLRDERDRMYKANVEKNGEILRLLEENAKLKQELESVGTAAYLYGRNDLADENAKLREQTERLVTLLRNDCDIEASWDGLRHFWSIELTEDGCLMRDRACKAEAENVKLRELVRDFDKCLTEAVRLAYIQGHMTIYDGTLLDSLHPRMRELGVEVPS